MNSSIRGAPPSSGVVATLLSEAFKFWRSGLALGGFVAVVLSVRWLHISSHIYESRVGIERAAGDATARPNLEAELARLQELAKAAVPDAPENVILRGLPGGGLALFCRAEDRQVAHDHCESASRALQQAGGLRALGPATLASRPLPASPDASFVVIVTSIAIGLLGGASWMLARALLGSRPAKRPLRVRSNPPRPMHRISYAPAAAPRVVMATPSKSARASRPAQDRPGTALATIVDTDDEGTVIPLHVGTDWTMNPELLKLDAASDLAKLRDALCVAATEGCFVVGITSMPEASHLKSRLAAQLAWLLSQTEHARVLLLEVDFAHPNVADVMQLDMPPLSGFSQQLQAHIQEGQAPWVVMRCTSSLCVLAEGRVRTPGVIYTNEFTVALAQLRRNFDLIVADGPAIGVHVDTRAFDDVADGIVFVTSTSTPVEQALSTASQWFRSRRLMAAATVRERQAS